MPSIGHLSRHATGCHLHTSQLSIGYTPDIFGSNIRQVHGRRATRDYQRFQFEAAYITLASNLVAAALQEARLRAQIDAARKIIGIIQQSLDIILHQHAVGYAVGIDIARQQAALERARQNLPPLERQLEQTRNLIGELSDKLPSSGRAGNLHHGLTVLPRDLPVSLPSELIASSERNPLGRGAVTQRYRSGRDRRPRRSHWALRESSGVPASSTGWSC